MEYKVVITSDAEADLDRFIRALRGWIPLCRDVLFDYGMSIGVDSGKAEDYRG